MLAAAAYNAGEGRRRSLSRRATVSRDARLCEARDEACSARSGIRTIRVSSSRRWRRDTGAGQSRDRAPRRSGTFRRALLVCSTALGRICRCAWAADVARYDRARQVVGRRRRNVRADACAAVPVPRNGLRRRRRIDHRHECPCAADDARSGARGRRWRSRYLASPDGAATTCAKSRRSPSTTARTWRSLKLTGRAVAGAEVARFEHGARGPGSPDDRLSDRRRARARPGDASRNDLGDHADRHSAGARGRSRSRRHPPPCERTVLGFQLDATAYPGTAAVRSTTRRPVTCSAIVNMVFVKGTKELR